MANNTDNTTTASTLTAAANSLLPCPFCGEQPEYIPQTEGPPEHGPSAYWPHQVSHNCAVVNVNMCVRADGGRTPTPEKVFAMWNTRFHAANNKSTNAEENGK